MERADGARRRSISCAAGAAQRRGNQGHGFYETDGLANEAELARRSPAYQAGVRKRRMRWKAWRAFREKRPPQWKGRSDRRKRLWPLLSEIRGLWPYDPQPPRGAQRLGHGIYNEWPRKRMNKLEEKSRARLRDLTGRMKREKAFPPGRQPSRHRDPDVGRRRLRHGNRSGKFAANLLTIFQSR